MRMLRLGLIGLITIIGLVMPATSNAQANNPPRPTVQELDFLVGEWEITFEFHDTHKPELGVVFREEGKQSCFYDMELNGKPMFITCKGEVISGRGRKRAFQESIRYNQFIGAFERIGMFANWPAHSIETVLYHPEKRQLELRGELGVQDGLLERYEDFYDFDDNFLSYTRKQVGNFSDMPVSEFNLTLTGTGRKITK